MPCTNTVYAKIIIFCCELRCCTTQIFIETRSAHF